MLQIQLQKLWRSEPLEKGFGQKSSSTSPKKIILDIKGPKEYYYTCIRNRKF